MRLWIERDAVVANTKEDGDLIINTEDFYFFKRSEIANEDGFHLEFNNNMNGGFEIYITYKEFRNMLRQMDNRILDYAIEKDET